MLQGVGAGVRLVIGVSAMRMTGIAGFLHSRALFELDLAFTTIAAGRAAIAQVIGAGVLGAGRADARGFLPADTTIERHN